MGRVKMSGTTTLAAGRASALRSSPYSPPPVYLIATCSELCGHPSACAVANLKGLYSDRLSPNSYSIIFQTSHTVPDSELNDDLRMRTIKLYFHCYYIREIPFPFEEGYE
jgi:hypothetical protein